MVMLNWLGVIASAMMGAEASSAVKIDNIEFPSSYYGELGVVVTVESDKSKVECIAYRDGVPVGSGEAHTTARIANVSVLITKRAGELTVKCM